MKKKAKRAAREKDPTKMSADEYAVWAKGKTDEEIREHFPHLRLPPRPPVVDSRELTERQILQKLPEPPPENASDRQILEWLRKVGDVGGSVALMLVFSSNRYWPFGPRARADVWSAAIKIQDDVLAREKAEATKRNEEAREKALKAAAKGPKGWWDRVANV